MFYSCPPLLCLSRNRCCLIKTSKCITNHAWMRMMSHTDLLELVVFLSNSISSSLSQSLRLSSESQGKSTALYTYMPISLPHAASNSIPNSSTLNTLTPNPRKLFPCICLLCFPAAIANQARLMLS
ncbi:hypothetical protein VTJ04DRAFT_1018 [Mycothermus thermophilus]|uniref:uncharacterized protein n=1 Tax=Humicola insolens TaxID=85995 RepID=UPI0037426E99